MGSRSGSEQLYKTLNDSRSEIRVLEILSTGSTETFECRLHTVSLDDKPAYAALSYVWGDSKITEDIQVNDQRVSITTNLAAALRHVKAHWQTALLDRDPASFRIWADALCINQADLAERQSQVQLMKRIYSGAEMVISWVGQDLEGIDLAFEIYKTILAETKDQGPKSEDFSMNWLYRYPDWFEGDRMWKALNNFSSLNYWKRIWIFQELILGHNIHLTHGTTSAPLSDFIEAGDWLHRLRGAYNSNKLLALPPNMQSLTTLPGFYELQRVIEVRERVEYHGGALTAMQTREVLSMLIAEFAATDPRDYVYGLLGILKTGIIPDYTKTPAEVYTKFFEWYIRDTRVLTFLYVAGVGIYDDEPDTAIPSWAPNYVKRVEAMGKGLIQSTNSWPDAGWGNADKGIFENLKRFEDLPKMEEGKIVTAVLDCGDVVEVHLPVSVESMQDDTLYCFIRDLVGVCEEGENAYHPIAQVFWALRPVNVAAPDTIPLRQAVAFLCFLLNYPRQPDISQIEQIISRAAGLGLILDLKTDIDIETSDLAKALAPVALRALNFQQEDTHVKFVLNLLLEDSYLLHPPLSALQHLFDTQVLFRLATINMSNRVVLVPRYSRPGDSICILKYCKVPMVLRGTPQRAVVVGAAFMYGVMYGEFGGREYNGDEWYFGVVKLV